MKINVWIIAIVTMISCKEDKLVERPENLIPQEEMTEILYDLALINGLRSTTAIVETYGIETMPYLYEKYGIDSLQFIRSDLYYASQPIQYQKMYQFIADRLENKLEEIKKVRTQQKDSTLQLKKQNSETVTKKTKPIKSVAPPKK